MKKIYLACPYNDKDPEVREERFLAVNKKAGELMSKGYLVYSPISHSHPIAVQCALPKDWDFWRSFDIEYIKWVDEVWVLRLEGWKESTGVKFEMSLAEKLGKPVIFVDI